MRPMDLLWRPPSGSALTLPAIPYYAYDGAREIHRNEGPNGSVLTAGYFENELDHKVLELIVAVARQAPALPVMPLTSIFIPGSTSRLPSGLIIGAILANNVTLLSHVESHLKYRTKFDYSGRDQFDDIVKVDMSGTPVLRDGEVILAAWPKELGRLLIFNEEVYERGVPIARGVMTPTRWRYTCATLVFEGAVQLFAPGARKPITYAERFDQSDEDFFGELSQGIGQARAGKTAWDHVAEREFEGLEAAKNIKGFSGIGRAPLSIIRPKDDA